jgi:N-methylhydantoinase A
MGWMMGVDVGGTFADFFAFDETSERTIVHKVPSTPSNPSATLSPPCLDLAA